MDPRALRDFLDALVKDPDLQPKDGRTFCNRAAIKAAEFFGCRDFDFPNPDADAMYGYLQSNLSGKWSHIDPEFAATQAQAGELVFAALPHYRLGDATHGHIATVYPRPMELSGTLNQLVPILANVGKPDFCRVGRTSEFFPVKAHGLPHFYLYVRGAVTTYHG